MNPRILPIIITMLLLFPAALFADGDRLFSIHCSGCHGPGGEGGRAPALRKNGLLITVEQGYFVKSIRAGRKIHGCPSFNDKIGPEKRMPV